MTDWDELDDAGLAAEEEAMSSQLSGVLLHLGEHAPAEELSGVFRHRRSGALLFAMGGALFAYRDGAAVRYRGVGSEMMEMVARREGELVGKVVVREESLFPGGAPELPP